MLIFSKQNQSGFNLIELMIVVTIIGVLAALAFPQYQDYVTRTRWSHNNVAINSVKMAMADCFQTNQLENGDITATLCGSTGTTPELTNVILPTADTNLAAAIIIPTTGAIVVTGTVAAGGCVITWTPNIAETSVAWTGVTSPGCTKDKTGI